MFILLEQNPRKKKRKSTRPIINFVNISLLKMVLLSTTTNEMESPPTQQIDLTGKSCSNEKDVQWKQVFISFRLVVGLVAPSSPCDGCHPVGRICEVRDQALVSITEEISSMSTRTLSIRLLVWTFLSCFWGHANCLTDFFILSSDWIGNELNECHL